MAFKTVAKFAPVFVSVRTQGDLADGPVFVADRAYEVLEVIETHSTAGAASSTLDIKKAAAGTAPASGTSILASTFALDSTANTPVRKNIANGGMAAKSVRTISEGDSLCFDGTGTLTAHVGCVTLVLKPVVALGASY